MHDFLKKIFLKILIVLMKTMDIFRLFVIFSQNEKLIYLIHYNYNLKTHAKKLKGDNA